MYILEMGVFCPHKHVFVYKDREAGYILNNLHAVLTRIVAQFRNIFPNRNPTTVASTLLISKFKFEWSPVRFRLFINFIERDNLSVNFHENSIQRGLSNETTVNAPLFLLVSTFKGPFI